MNATYDVIIVGAGPAGSHLAIRLARLGWSVALLDKRRFPRPKPCGEFMGPECLPLLDELGLLEPALAQGGQRIHSLSLHGYGHRARGGFNCLGHATIPFHHGLAARRETLDAQAVRVAESEPGVCLLEGHAFLDLLRNREGRVVGLRGATPRGEPFELRGKFTVGADGLNSRVARQLGVGERIPWLERFALCVRIRRGCLDGAELHIVPGGHLAIAPVDDEWATLNLLISKEDVPSRRSELNAGIQRFLERAPALAERLPELDPSERVFACGPLAHRTRAQVFDGAALVGDACGFVDPLTGEGLFYGMRGAQLLAETIHSALHAGRCDRSSLRPYARARRREFGHRRAMSYLLQRGMKHPVLVRGFLRALESRPNLNELFMGMMNSSVHPRLLVRPSVMIPALLSGSKHGIGA